MIFGILPLRYLRAFFSNEQKFFLAEI